MRTNYSILRISKRIGLFILGSYYKLLQGKLLMERFIKSFKFQFDQMIYLILMVMLNYNLNAQVDPKPLAYFTQEEIELANTADEISYMSSQEKRVFMWMNLARIYPQRFIEVVEYYAQQEYGGSYNPYVKSLVKDLNKHASLDAIQPSKLMFDMAECWAMEAGQLGLEGHNRKKCDYQHDAECCGYVDENSGFYHLVSLLVDEGVPNLAHRKIILSEEYHFAGVSIQPHKQYGKNIVIDFSRIDK